MSGAIPIGSSNAACSAAWAAMESVDSARCVLVSGYGGMWRTGEVVSVAVCETPMK